MKKTLLLSLLFPACLFSQEVISTQGDSYSNGNATIDFTIGETIIETVDDGNTEITQGFHQSNWRFVSLEDHQPEIELSVYPNPVEDILNIETADFLGLEYSLYDSNGKLVLSGKLENVKSEVYTSQLAPSAYTLILKNQDSEKIKTLKLIKSQ